MSGVVSGLRSTDPVRISGVCRWDDYSAHPDYVGFVLLTATDGRPAIAGLPQGFTVTRATEPVHGAAIAHLEAFLATLSRDHADRIGVIRAIEVLRYVPED